MKSRVWCFVFGLMLCGQVWGADRVKLELVGEYTCPDVYESLTVSGSRIYALNGTTGLDVLDISNPRQPHLTDNYDVGIASTASDQTAVAVAGLHAYVVGLNRQEDSGRFAVVEIGNLASLPPAAVVGSCVLSGISPTGIALGGEYAYVVGGDTMAVVDISTPTQPRQVGTVPIPCSANEITLFGGYLFVVGGSHDNFVVLDITQPAEPTELGRCTIQGYTKNVSIRDGYAFVTSHGRWDKGWEVVGSGLVVVDVRNPHTPEVVQRCGPDEAGYSGGIGIAGNLAFVTSPDPWGARMEAIDVTSPLHPQVVGRYIPEWPFDGNALAVSDQNNIVVSSGRTLLVFAFTELPAITRQSVQYGKLNLQWNEPARGMKLQRSTSLENPDWQSLEGSEATTSAELPLWGGPEYFRLTFDAPENTVWIPAGTFMMGSSETEQDRNENEGPQTEVTLTQGFFMGKYEVTQGEYLAVMGNNPSWFNGDRTGEGGNPDYGTDLNRPVERMGWENAVAYCEALTAQERTANRIPQGFAYSLPTEAQWEVACRAGSTTRFSYGDDPDYTQLGDYAWYSENSDGMTHSVGQKWPNAFGLYGMHGNVWEWCQDWFALYPGGNAVDPIGNAENLIRVARGGGLWTPSECRSAARLGYVPAVGDICGFRVVLAPARP